MDTPEQSSTTVPKSAWITRGLNWVTQFQFVVGVIFGIALAVIAAAFWTRDQARNAVREPAFVEELSKRVRPFMIVDNHRTVLSDYGAADTLAHMNFEVPTNRSEMKITFSFKQHMNNPPLVQPMNHGLYLHHVERGSLHDWVVWMRVAPETIFDLGGATGPATMELSPIDTNRQYRFLVEILH